MHKLFSLRPSAGMIVSVVALIALASGGAYAATRASGTIHGCSSKRSGALRLARNCKRSERGVSWSITGPQGSRGPQGPQGVPGQSGASVVAGFHNLAIPFPFSTTTFTTMTGIPLPAGKWTVFAKGTVTNVAGAGATVAHCQLASPAGEIDDTVLALDDHNLGTAYSGTMVLNISTTLTSAGTITLNCRNEGGGNTDLSFVKFTAIQDASLTNTGL